jgi:hypothetical protein
MAQSTSLRFGDDRLKQGYGIKTGGILRYAQDDLTAPRAGAVKSENPKLLENGILERFRRAQADDGLRLDLDRFTGLGVAAHASFAVRLDDAADARNHEFARATLGFLDRELEKLFKKGSCGFLGCAGFFGDVCNDLGLAQRLGCHLLFLSSSVFQSASKLGFETSRGFSPS